MKRQRRMNLPSFVNLPPEMCAEILFRLPVKSLLRSRCVSKSWCSLIDDPYFVSTYLTRCPKNNEETPQLLVVEPPDMVDGKQLCTFRRGDTFRKMSRLGIEVAWYEHYHVAGYINGVFCMKKYRVESQICEIFLWNSSIKKRLDLPMPRIAFMGRKLDVDLAFGFDPIRNDYKLIASLYTPGGQIHFRRRVEIYTLNEGFWRCIAIGEGPCSWSKDGPKVYLNGFTYWVGMDLLKSTPKGKYTHIVSFDTHNEIFTYTELPDCEDVDALEHQRFPVINGGSIALMDIFRTHSYIWVKEDSKTTNAHWTKRYSINLPLFQRFLHLKTNGELLFGEDRGVKSYNIENEEIKVLAKSYRITPIFTSIFVESLVLLNGAHSKGKHLCTFPQDRSVVHLPPVSMHLPPGFYYYNFF